MSIRMAPECSCNFRDRLELDAYHLFNLNTGLVYDSWEVMLYIKNITDENPQLSFDRERGGRRPPGLSRRPTPHVRHTQPLLLLKPGCTFLMA